MHIVLFAEKDLHVGHALFVVFDEENGFALRFV
jgi:hypothetical protein